MSDSPLQGGENDLVRLVRTMVHDYVSEQDCLILLVVTMKGLPLSFHPVMVQTISRIKLLFEFRNTTMARDTAH